jgi:hypothetical protein
VDECKPLPATSTGLSTHTYRVVITVSSGCHVASFSSSSRAMVNVPPAVPVDEALYGMLICTGLELVVP